MKDGKRALLRERYERAAHRVQTAIACVPEHPNQTPKHMRTGIDMTKSDIGGLAGLLIEKGVFTEEEYVTALCEAAEKEADGYENELSIRFGRNIRTRTFYGNGKAND